MIALINLLAEVPAPVDGNPIQKITQTFHVHWTLFVSQLISFLVVCALLYKFAYTPILALLEQRRERIAAGEIKLEEIERKLADSEKHTAELIEKANADAKRMITEAQASAAALSEKKAIETDNEIQRRLAAAEEASKAERAQLANELKRDFGRLVTVTTAKVSGKILNDDDQRRINEEALQTIQN